MTIPVSLRSAEREAFRASFSDGLWDVLIGSFALVFALAPVLSESLGDFWSSALFLPFWGLVYLGIRLIRKHAVEPRLGRARFGAGRRRRLRRLGLALLSLNVAALVAGIAAYLTLDPGPGWALGGILGAFLLTGMSAGAFFLDCPRLYAYGLVFLAAPFAGEWLAFRFGAAHHGFPAAFGVAAAIPILTGLVLLAAVLRRYPPVPSEEA